MLFRDGAKPNFNKKIFIKIKKAEVLKKIQKFSSQFYRNIEISFTGDRTFIINQYDAHDLLTKYYFEGSMWDKDMNESFSMLTAHDYFNYFSEMYDIISYQREAPFYITKIWEVDFQSTSDFPYTHVSIVAEKV